jgi:UPF0716 family protein affecting phage T7 exclusion
MIGGSRLRIEIVIVGIVLMVAGFFASPLGPVSWIPFIGGFIVIGIGLMIDSRAKAAAKARAARMRKYRY